MHDTILSEFKDYLNMRNLSQRTVEEYPIAIEYFLNYLREYYVDDVRMITSKHIRYFHEHLTERVYRGKLITSSTQRQYLGKIKAFFKFMYKTGKITTDPAAHIDLPKRAKGLPRNILDVDEMRTLLEQPDLSTSMGIRDRAILELFYSSGIRSSELISLELKNINMSNREMFILGKGNKEALVPFGREAHRALDNYLIFARSKLLGSPSGGGGRLSQKRKDDEDDKEYLFVSKNGHRITKANVGTILKKYIKQAGIDKKCTPHGIRHSCATHLLKFGADIRHIQQLLRHASLDTTQIYTRVNIDDLKEAQSKFHPREIQSRETV